MKRFIFSVLTVTVFFLGVGALVERTGAKFKSDEKALDLIRKARIAIGGDSAIANIQSMRIVGKTTQNVRLNGTEKSEAGETEIAFMLPDKMMKMVKFGDGTGEAHQIIERKVDVVVVGEQKGTMQVTVDAVNRGEGRGKGTGAGSGSGDVKRIVIKKDDGTVQELTGSDAEKFIVKDDNGGGERHIVIKKDDGSVDEKVIVAGAPMKMRTSGGEGNATFTTKDDGQTMILTRDGGPIERGMMTAHHDGIRQNELLRTTLGLLLTAPVGMDVEYAFGGEGAVDGTACNIVVATFGGQAYKLFLDRSSNLPVALNYFGSPMPKVFTFTRKADGTEPAGTFNIKLDAPAADGNKDVMIFKRAEGGDHHAMVEYQLKFSDYRSTGGVQLPYKWTQTVAGAANETFEVTSYDINPANIAEKFQGDKVMVRTVKPDNK